MPNYGIYNKLMQPWLTLEEVNDQAQEAAIEAQVRSLDLLPVGALLDEELLAGNKWNLANAVYGAFDHEKPHNVIRGVVAGAAFVKRCKINGHASVFGVEFSDADEPSATELVRVGPGVAASFINCIFRRDPSSVGDMVRVEEASAVTGSTDARAVFIGCIFIDGGPTTINNVGWAAPGDEANVQAIGCVNGTGNPRLDGTSGAEAVQITETGTVAF